MSRPAGPRAGTMTRMALEALYDHGGVLSIDDLRALGPATHRAPAMFQEKVLQPLEKWQMAFCDGAQVRLAQSGSAFIGTARTTRRCTEPAPPTAAPVPPRSAPEFRELAPGALRAGGPSRPGMDDYKRIPSLFCGKRILPGGATE